MAVLRLSTAVASSPNGFDVQTPGGLGGSTPDFFRSGS